MIYRRALLLGILESLGGSVSDEAFQLYIYLFTRMQVKPTYQFMPSKLGAYSFELRHDHRMMIVGETILDISTQWSVADEGDHFTTLKPRDKQIIGDLLFETQGLSVPELKRLVYKRDPFLALYLPDVEEYLSAEELTTLRQYQFGNAKPQLYTIGYEMRHVEEYVNELIQNGVRYVVDTRRNAFSIKFGFKKSQLETELGFVGIGYEHIRELGVDSAKRKGVESEKDWERVFKEYEEETLPQAGAALERVRDLLIAHNRIALTCYERAPEACHRLRVVYALQSMQGWKWDVVHL